MANPTHNEPDPKPEDAALDAGSPDAEPGAPADEAQPATKPVPPGAKWYIVHTYSGFESKVKLALEQRIKDAGLDERFGEILVPQQQVQERNKREGASNKGMRKLFPGYIIVQMVLDSETWHLVNDTPKVTGFVGNGKKPRPVPARQVEALREKLDSGPVAPKVELSLDKGDKVRITAGPFANFVGVVDESRPERQKVRVLVSIFGRSTPIDLDFNQVEPVK